MRSVSAKVSETELARVGQAHPMPLYHQIYVLLQQKIISGDYAVGSLLPSENDIERLFGVSRITAKRALDKLANDGFATRQRGRGTIVTYERPDEGPQADNMEGLMENLLNIVKGTKVSLIESRLVAAHGEIAAALQVDDGTMVDHAIRVRRKGKTPFSYAITYVPEDIAKSFKSEELTERPLLALIERSGVSISHARQIITATLADAELCTHLDVEMGYPLLMVTRTVFDKNDRPVEYIRVYYRPDVYQVSLNLSRVQGGETNFWSTTEPDTTSS